VTDALAFSKYQGTGNDFILLADLDDEREIDAAAAAALCDRRFGIGADGTIRVVRVDGRFQMDHRNADGSHAEMCGNGIRCLGKFVFDRGLTDATELDVLTRAGMRHLGLDVREGEVRAVAVGMGLPRFQRHEIPMRGPAWETFTDQPFELAGAAFRVSAVSMGNPHVVVLCDEDPARYHVEHIGPAIERHELFPERTNVEFAYPRGDDRLDVRVWERGVGETMACGTGACAALIAANDAGWVRSAAEIRFPGGSVRVERGSDDVVLTGDAVHVFDGVVDRPGAPGGSRGAPEGLARHGSTSLGGL
jgi:diaminopimelate epimerase